MKKIISVILCIIMVLPLSAFAIAADNTNPVIFIPGYSSSQMFINRGMENERKVWKYEVADELIDALKKEIPALLKDGGQALFGKYDSLFATLEPYADEITEYLRINDDGTSKYDVEVYPHSVETTRLDKLKKIGYYPDYDTLKLLGNATDEKNIYCCTLDWRLGQIDNAKVLNDYIDDVLRATGAKKVNLLGVSYGGQVAASYLSIYGGDKVLKAVLHCPALNGSSIVPQLFSGEDINIAWSDTLKLVQTFRKEETDFSEITDVISPDCLNGFVKEFVRYYLLDLFMNFGSAWDLVPAEQYAALRDRLLKDGRHEEIIRKSDTYHSEVAANLKENLRRLRGEGVQISIIAGYGYNLVTANGMTSDGVIETASSTGAFCAPAGKTLGKDYAGAGCGDSSHCHIPGNLCLDAAAGYLPENTWYVEDMFHGLGTNENAVSHLITDLLFTDKITDVHSCADYPQFMTSDNPFTGVFCSFSSCPQGYCTPYSAELTITNLSKENSIQIYKISAPDTGLKFTYSVKQKLAPGESVTVGVFGKTPDNLTAFSVIVDYTAIKDNVYTAKSRTQSFRFTNSSLAGISADETMPPINESGSGKSGIVDIFAFFARIWYLMKQFFSRINSFSF